MTYFAPATSQRFTRTLALVALLLISTPSLAQRPNIVWISVEDMSPHLGVYDDPVARTPNLDRLAAEGVRFSRAFTTSAVCAPSRSAIITGMYPTSIGTHHHRTSSPPTPYSAVPPPHVKAFTEYLRAAGYYTSNDAKTDYQFAPHTDPRQPLTAWDESGPGAHYKHRRNTDQPFFSVFNYTGTHESRIWPRAGEPIQTDTAAIRVPPYYPDVPVVREDLARMYDNIAAMDAWAGDILDNLRTDGLLTNTIVMFWSDHGDGMPRAKRWLYDSGIKIPLIIRWPGQLPAGTVDQQLVSAIDLAPTVLALAGVPIPVHLQGRPFLGPNRSAPREVVFAARDRHDEAYDRVRAVRDRRFKYIQNFYPYFPYVQFIADENRNETMKLLLRFHAENRLSGAQKLWFQAVRPPEELYDTETDPYEIRNLADEPAFAGVKARLRAALETWQVESGDMGGISEDAMVASMWPGGVQPATHPPLFIPNAANHPSSNDAPTGGTFVGPVLLMLQSPTQGASIAYALGNAEPTRWLLYHKPLSLPTGTTLVRARSIRYGYRESEEVRAVFTITR
jgi:N-sulfoglucosamine sulfohydrolase